MGMKTSVKVCVNSAKRQRRRRRESSAHLPSCNGRQIEKRPGLFIQALSDNFLLGPKGWLGLQTKDTCSVHGSEQLHDTRR